MTSPARLLRNYIFWSYERGSIHFDIMVTLILIFMFVGPHYINFHDKPVPTVPLHEAAVVVKPAGRDGRFQRYQYEIRAEDLGTPKDDDDLQEAVRNAIEPISGAVTIQKVEPVQDAGHKVVAYNVTVLR
jgi:hypothetical protein